MQVTALVKFVLSAERKKLLYITFDIGHHINNTVHVEENQLTKISFLLQRLSHLDEGLSNGLELALVMVLTLLRLVGRRFLQIFDGRVEKVGELGEHFHLVIPKQYKKYQ